MIYCSSTSDDISNSPSVTNYDQSDMWCSSFSFWVCNLKSQIGENKEEDEDADEDEEDENAVEDQDEVCWKCICWEGGTSNS